MQIKLEAVSYWSWKLLQEGKAWKKSALTLVQQRASVRGEGWCSNEARAEHSNVGWWFVFWSLLPAPTISVITLVTHYLRIVAKADLITILPFQSHYKRDYTTAKVKDISLADMQVHSSTNSTPLLLASALFCRPPSPDAHALYLTGHNVIRTHNSLWRFLSDLVVSHSIAGTNKSALSWSLKQLHLHFQRKCYICSVLPRPETKFLVTDHHLS